VKTFSLNFFVYGKIKKKRCWSCNSLLVIRWGKQLNKQRFKCKDCGILFTRNAPEQKIKNRFIWFKKWVLERQTYKTLSRDSGLSIDTLQRTFYHYLDKAPKFNIYNNGPIQLRIDGTYFNQFCLICYQSNRDNFIQLIRFSDGEKYEEIRNDLENLTKLGLVITSVTTDGHKSIIKAVKKALPRTKLQRCLVHIQRMCLIWLTKHPKHIAGAELRMIVMDLMKIKTNNDKTYWINLLMSWFQRHKIYINEKTINEITGRYWYTHKLLRRSYFTIKRALPNMFLYIDNPEIPATTNGIEGYFGHLKNHLDLHRGLTKKHRIEFIKWYIYFKNEM
jgi:hypothetical protein